MIQSLALVVSLFLCQNSMARYQATPVLSDQGVIWSIEPLPGTAKILFTERQGKLKLLDRATGHVVEVKGLPKIKASGQSGLMDVELDPQFKKNRQIYLTYSAAYGKEFGTFLARAQLEKNSLKNFKVLYRPHKSGATGRHFGSRIVVTEDGHIFWSTGDRGERDKAQKLDHPQGKIMRLKTSGDIPKDNPFVSTKGALPQIWSYGHRNPQGLSLHPFTKELWSNEHGPRGGDEINKIKKGRNFGWPKITYGREYWGPKIGTTHAKDMVQPLKYFVPSIAPSSLMIYSGKRIKEWKGHVFSGALVLTHLNRLQIKNNKVIEEERLFKDLDERIRDVKEDEKGNIYFATDSGKIYQIEKRSQP